MTGRLDPARLPGDEIEPELFSQNEIMQLRAFMETRRYPEFPAPPQKTSELVAWLADCDPIAKIQLTWGLNRTLLPKLTQKLASDLKTGEGPKTTAENFVDGARLIYLGFFAGHLWNELRESSAVWPGEKLIMPILKSSIPKLFQEGLAALGVPSQPKQTEKEVREILKGIFFMKKDISHPPENLLNRYSGDLLEVWALLADQKWETATSKFVDLVIAHPRQFHWKTFDFFAEEISARDTFTDFPTDADSIETWHKSKCEEILRERIAQARQAKSDGLKTAFQHRVKAREEKEQDRINQFINTLGEVESKQDVSIIESCGKELIGKIIHSWGYVAVVLDIEWDSADPRRSTLLVVKPQSSGGAGKEPYYKTTTIQLQRLIDPNALIVDKSERPDEIEPSVLSQLEAIYNAYVEALSALKEMPEEQRIQVLDERDVQTLTGHRGWIAINQQGLRRPLMTLGDL